MDRHKSLKFKISKIMRGIKGFLINNPDISKVKLRHQIVRTENNILGVMKNDLERLKNSLNGSEIFQLIVAGQCLGNVKVEMKDYGLFEIPTVDALYIEFKDVIKGYIEVFVTGIQKDPSSAVTEVYVDIILEAYLKYAEIKFTSHLVESPDAKLRYNGKIQVF